LTLFLKYAKIALSKTRRQKMKRQSAISVVRDITHPPREQILKASRMAKEAILFLAKELERWDTLTEDDMALYKYAYQSIQAIEHRFI
jgi:hypothetical protein